MEQDDPCRPFLVLGDIVQDFAYIDHTGFQIVQCRRREAYDCGPNGDAIVRGLDLFVRRGHDGDDAKLCYSATDEVLKRVGSEIDDDKARLHGRRLRIYCRIYTVDGNVMVLRISFIASFSCMGGDFRSYYLVYDSVSASLVLLSRRPPSCRPIFPTIPLILNAGEEEDKKYSLVLMAEEVSSEEERSPNPVLCLWSPPPAPDDNGNNSECASWELKGRVPVVDAAIVDPFQANQVFLFKGNAVWADLAQGIMYCDCRDLTINDSRMEAEPPVDFKHIMLPRECWWTKECRWTEDGMDVLDHCYTRTHRGMGCVGDSIWFVIIEPNSTCPGDTLVKVWTLDLLSPSQEEAKSWKLHREFKMLEVFRAQGWYLPETVPKFPIVRGQQDILYMLLPEPYTDGDTANYGHLVCIDLSSSSYEVRLQSSRRLTIPLMDHPVVLDQDFFNHLEHTS